MIHKENDYQIRTKEINKIAFLLSIRNGIMAVSMSIPIFASMLAFITFSLTHGAGSLDPAPVFSSLALFNALRIPLNLLPMVIGQVVDANASLKRIEDFLNAEDQHDEASWDAEAKHAISVKSANFTWEQIAPFARSSMFSTIDIAGTTIERNATISRMKLRPSTNANTYGRFSDSTELKSAIIAGSPATLGMMLPPTLL